MPMTRPRQYLTRMVIFLIVATVVAAALISRIERAYLANPPLNTLIGAVLLFGIAYIFRQVVVLRQEVLWLETFRRAEPGLALPAPPKLLAPMAAMFRDHSVKIRLSAASSRSLLDSISARLDESRDTSRYVIALMIFLGLLGTFWGLLITVGSIGDTINSLSPGTGNLTTIFNNLKHGLQGPLAGMGTAFSSSLLGLAGSLILGFLDLQASQAQNRFYNEFEEWLATVTRVSGGVGSLEGEATVPAYVQALLEQTADSLENLQRTMARAEGGRGTADAALLQLTERLATLTDQMRAEGDLLIKLVEHQMAMKPILERFANMQESGGLDAASRSHLRNLDIYVGRLVEAVNEGRNQIVQDLRSEIRLLARTIAATGEERKG